jgi:hypothetical protein
MTDSNFAVPELATVEVGSSTRSAFLVRGTLAAGAAFGAASITPYVKSALAQSKSTDVDILNYALTLEYLESEFYKQGLTQAGLSGEAKKTAQQLGEDESAHVDALISAIKGAGGKPVASPTFDFGMAFANQKAFLKTAEVFEDTGVSAYNGAAPMIKSTAVLAAAGSIVQIEARHAALIRLLNGATPAPDAFDKALKQAAVLKAVKPYIKA